MLEKYGPLKAFKWMPANEQRNKNAKILAIFENEGDALNATNELGGEADADKGEFDLSGLKLDFWRKQARAPRVEGEIPKYNERGLYLRNMPYTAEEW